VKVTPRRSPLRAEEAGQGVKAEVRT
jgi:hypothetical protein